MAEFILWLLKALVLSLMAISLIVQIFRVTEHKRVAEHKDEDVKYLTASWIKDGFKNVPIYRCSNCNHMSSVMTNYCPNCHGIMVEEIDVSDKETKAEWKNCNRHGDIFYECSHCGSWSHYRTNYCYQCNYPMKAGWKVWFVEHDCE